jgi:hypothetical protein
MLTHPILNNKYLFIFRVIILWGALIILEELLK